MRTYGISLKLSLESSHSKYVIQTLAQHNTQPRFHTSFEERAARWDICLTGLWIATHIPRRANILETGCGPGFNLLWLKEQGFENLYGLDIDPKAIQAGLDIVRHANQPLHLWVDDGVSPQNMRDITYAAILGINWTSLREVEHFSLSNYFNTYLPYLEDFVVFVFDGIDKVYNQWPSNEYHTEDLEKPVHERRASEYKIRISEEEVHSVVSMHGLRIIYKITGEFFVPKDAYVLARHPLPEITAHYQRHNA